MQVTPWQQSVLPLHFPVVFNERSLINTARRTLRDVQHVTEQPVDRKTSHKRLQMLDYMRFNLSKGRPGSSVQSETSRTFQHLEQLPRPPPCSRAILGACTPLLKPDWQNEVKMWSL